MYLDLTAATESASNRLGHQNGAIELNVKLKRVVTGVSLDKAMLRDVLQNKELKPVKKREMANYLMGRYTVGSRRACGCVRLVRSMYCGRVTRSRIVGT
jgi:hypothetical protein